MPAAKKTTAKVKPAASKTTRQPLKSNPIKSHNTQQKTTSTKPPQKVTARPNLSRNAKPQVTSARTLYLDDDEDEITSSSSLSDSVENINMEQPEEISEDDIDEEEQDSYRPKGPSGATTEKSDGNRAGRSTGTRIGGMTGGTELGKRASDTNKQSKSGTEKNRNDIAGDEMEVDHEAAEAQRGDDHRYSDAGKRPQAEEEEEEEEEYTQKEPIDLQLNLLQKRLLEGNAKHKTKRSQDRLIILDRSYARIKAEMEGVTVNVDSGSSGRMEVDKDEGDVEGEAEGRRGQKSGKEIGWDELMKKTRSTIKTIETMLKEMQDEFPVDLVEAEEGQGARADCWTAMDDEIKGYTEAFEPVMSMLKTYINEDLVDHIETVVQTGEDIGAFSGMLEEASKRTGKYTKRKMREQYEVAQRNVTAKSYINSVAKIMGVDLTPFRD